MKIGLIGDEDTVTGMLLAGIGHVDGQGKKNFLVVDSKVHIKDIEEQFHDLTARKDISMILITQRYSEAELRKALNDNITERKIDAMKRLLAAVSAGRDASALFPDVVPVVAAAGQGCWAHPKKQVRASLFSVTSSTSDLLPVLYTMCISLCQRIGGCPKSWR
eukprot:Skav220132  [mRNA]  locus=scaffold4510:52742:57079:- [translate_table: standard]